MCSDQTAVERGGWERESGCEETIQKTVNAQCGVVLLLHFDQLLVVEVLGDFGQQRFHVCGSVLCLLGVFVVVWW